MAPVLAYISLLNVRGCVAYLIGEHVHFAHQHKVRADGRLSDFTINLRGRVFPAFAARVAWESLSGRIERDT